MALDIYPYQYIASKWLEAFTRSGSSSTNGHSIYVCHIQEAGSKNWPPLGLGPRAQCCQTVPLDSSVLRGREEIESSAHAFWNSYNSWVNCICKSKSSSSKQARILQLPFASTCLIHCRISLWLTKAKASSSYSEGIVWEFPWPPQIVICQNENSRLILPLAQTAEASCIITWQELQGYCAFLLLAQSVWPSWALWVSLLASLNTSTCSRSESWHDSL